MKVNSINFINFGNSKVSLLAYNDCHGQATHLSQFIEEQDNFFSKNKQNTKITLSGGDVFLDGNEGNNIVSKKIISKTDAIAVGNHDIEAGNYLSDMINKFKTQGKWLSANLFFDKATPLKNDILKSTIIEKNGESFGVIGLSPFDYRKYAYINQNNDFIYTKNLEDSIKLIKDEVKKLKEKGINKIFLLAHTGKESPEGEKYYESFAKIDGIDVIIGGHDHKEVDTWDKTSSGEPVKIIATGKNGDGFFNGDLNTIAELELEFDDNGVLIQNSCTSKFKRFETIKNVNPEDIVYSFPRVLKIFPSVPKYSEITNLAVDSTLWYANSKTKGKKADIALANSGSIRGNIEIQNITEEDILSIVPYTRTKLIKTKLTKEQILKTLSWCALSTTFKKKNPSLMQVSGLKYTVNPDKSIKDVYLTDEIGNIKYNLSDFPADKEFEVVYDDFLMTGVAGLSELIKDSKKDDVEEFNVSRKDALIEYLKNNKLYDYTKPRIKLL